MEIEAKMNKIKTKNVQREEKEIQLEAQLELNVRKWSIFYFNF
jgi:GTP-binding protein EngB required for normal cell division